MCECDAAVKVGVGVKSKPYREGWSDWLRSGEVVKKSIADSVSPMAAGLFMFRSSWHFLLFSFVFLFMLRFSWHEALHSHE